MVGGTRPVNTCWRVFPEPQLCPLQVLPVSKYDSSAVVLQNREQILHHTFQIVGPEFIVWDEGWLVRWSLDSKCIKKELRNCWTVYDLSGVAKKTLNITLQRSAWLFAVQHHDETHVKPIHRYETRTNRNVLTSGRNRWGRQNKEAGHAGACSAHTYQHEEGM